MTYYTNGAVSFPLRPAKYKGTRRTTGLTKLIAKGIALGTALGAFIIYADAVTTYWT